MTRQNCKSCVLCGRTGHLFCSNVYHIDCQCIVFVTASMYFISVVRLVLCIHFRKLVHPNCRNRYGYSREDTMNSGIVTLDKRPSVIVFDLDRTLWPFQVDKDTLNPFKKNNTGVVVDSLGKEFSMFPGVPALLEKLLSSDFELGIASRIEDVLGAYQLLQLFEINSFFAYKEIYPGSKVIHFKQLQIKTGVEFSDMIFFDDDERNIRSVSRLGVTSFQVPHEGVCEEFVYKAIIEYSKLKSNLAS